MASADPPKGPKAFHAADAGPLEMTIPTSAQAKIPGSRHFAVNREARGLGMILPSF
jgi:hypothetical protein